MGFPEAEFSLGKKYIAEIIGEYVIKVLFQDLERNLTSIVLRMNCGNLTKIGEVTLDD